jgi:hypothetical protein
VFVVNILLLLFYCVLSVLRLILKTHIQILNSRLICVGTAVACAVGTAVACAASVLTHVLKTLVVISPYYLL